MAYKTILVHADGSVHAPARIRFAAALARAEGAHLVGLATTGVSRFMYPDDAAAPLARTVAATYAASLHEHANRSLEQFTAIAAAGGVASHEARLEADDPEGALVLMSRYADLVVLSQSDPAHQVAGAVRDLPEFVVLNIARPVLLLPYAGSFGGPGGHALVAWDGSLEAARALADSLPLLCRASAVTVAQFENGGPDNLGAHPADLAAWLARHGVQATIQARHGGIDDGNALLALAAELQSSLLVMGAYGHTRLHELLLGGVTKTVLGSMTTPVLMAH
jgi:nucleotide-binding universal stress UspA family protein